MIEHLTSKTFKETDWRCSILVVDGNSPDGTAEVVRAAQKGRPNVHLLVETKKEGLGAAYFKGFQHAIDQLGAEVLIEFDGDFQHPPESIPVLLKAIDDGADLVLGSRKVPGGSYPKDWDGWRLFLSKVGGFVARLLMFFPTKAFAQVTDPTTGLKATRVGEHYRKLDFAGFGTRGFGYKVEMLYKLVAGGARVAEIPLAFQSREEGESKMTGQTPVDVLFTALRLRLVDERTVRFIRFAVVGVTGVVVNLLCLELFRQLAFVHDFAAWLQGLFGGTFLTFLARPTAWAEALAAECSIINNFLWNNAWTFSKDRAKSVGGFFRKFGVFNVLSFGSILIQALSMALWTHALGDTPLVRNLTAILTICLLVVPYNWLMYNKVVWRRKKKLAA